MVEGGQFVGPENQGMELERFKDLLEGHGFISVQAAREVCAAADVLFISDLVISWQSRADAFSRYGFIPTCEGAGSGVDSLDLSYYLCRQFHLDAPGHAFSGVGSQSRANTDAILQELDKRGLLHHAQNADAKDNSVMSTVRPGTITLDSVTYEADREGILPDSRKRRLMHLLIGAILFFLVMPVLVWWPDQTAGQSFWLHLFSTAVSIGVGTIWIVLYRHYPAIVSWLAEDRSQDELWKAELFISHAMTPVAILIVDLPLAFFAQRFHTPILTEAVMLAVMTGAGTFWWILGIIFPHLLEQYTDYVANVGGAFGCVLILWLFAPGPALLMTVLVAAWLVLIRICPWLPQYRTSGETREKK
jgi:hypothetical protein